MTFFGATILMTVSLIEITFYISALNLDPAMMPSISLRLIYAVQHLISSWRLQVCSCRWASCLSAPEYFRQCLDIWRFY